MNLFVCCFLCSCQQENCNLNFLSYQRRDNCISVVQVTCFVLNFETNQQKLYGLLCVIKKPSCKPSWTMFLWYDFGTFLFSVLHIYWGLININDVCGLQSCSSFSAGYGENMKTETYVFGWNTHQLTKKEITYTCTQIWETIVATFLKDNAVS